VLVEEVRRFRESIERQDPLENLMTQARALSRRLLGPALESLAGRRLLIVPHGVLHYLPFAALRTAGDHWLIEEYPLNTLPSASVLRFLAGKGAGAPAPALAVGDPAAGTDLALRWAALEARFVGQRTHDATVLVGTATKGDELVGLQRAVLYAGAPAVITTLWRINDRASFELIRAFYDRLEKEGPVDALRDAQRETM
jgi:CHAT domain-containing protein